ncbi:major facilitator transporter [Enterobacter asburiae]|uniref:Major facilitator transporter n=1 Tax=Enterobacter asburiae TaxID=61645 RepID=A0A376F705_ENTAS|nr:major facilitator transporter [Enterobacter asburiae]
MRRELSVLMRPQVLSALLTTVLGAGAMFTLYTYISPVLHDITHATPLFVTAMLVLIGVGFSIGNYLGGKFADRSVSGTLKGFLTLLIVIMVAIPWLARNEFGGRDCDGRLGSRHLCRGAAAADARNACRA